MNTQHTPTPWYKNGTCIFAQKNPGGTKIHLAEVLRDCGAVTARHNALMIVQAVNSHEKACSVLERCLALFDDSINHSEAGQLERDVNQVLLEMRGTEATGHLKGVQK